MSALVIYESMFGNTRLIAEAIADGFGEPGVAVVLPAHLVDVGDLAAADLVIVGAPTHAWGMPRRQTRRGAQDAAAKQPEIRLEPESMQPGVREWLRRIPPQSARRAVAFDTRLDKPMILTGSAGRKIDRTLRRRGFEVVDKPESFVVTATGGPLGEGELARAREWGKTLGLLLIRTPDTTGRRAR